ncbi:Zinc finger C2HC domain-containing protein 1A [Tritrichomonas musculus]|uniref:Zinc finger C2HC domain-containing protein 1A n=1 Tax=Tritrichomonas musculus TaxID=1915356 RepID=A0ABR2H9Z3_9EUKA
MSDFETWTTEQLVQQLNSNGFQDVSSCFSKHEITGDLLPLMEDDHLKEIGISSVGRRLHVTKWILELTENSPASINYGTPTSQNSTPSPSKTRNLNNSTNSFSSSGTLSQTFSPSATSKPSTATMKTRQSAPKTSSGSSANPSSNQSKSSRPKTAANSGNQENVPKCKRDHDKMVEQIRAARKYAAYQKAVEEGRAVGPPPELPPIEEPPDLVQCPYCGRKFGEEAARRHIPVCERSSFSKQNRPHKK